MATSKLSVGDKINQLLVLKKAEDHIDPKSGSRFDKWLCECSCGKIKEMFENVLLRPTTHSCGCYVRALKSKHGKSKTPEYKSWTSMHERCKGNIPNHATNYKDKGITVCDRWNPEKRGSFENFLEDMGLKTPYSSLDRIDPSLGYTPENCRWALASQQAINKGVSKANLSGYTGIDFIKEGVFRVRGQLQGKRYNTTVPSLEIAIKFRIFLEELEYGESPTARRIEKSKVDLKEFIPAHLLEVKQYEWDSAYGTTDFDQLLDETSDS